VVLIMSLSKPVAIDDTVIQEVYQSLDDIDVLCSQLGFDGNVFSASSSIYSSTDKSSSPTTTTMCSRNFSAYALKQFSLDQLTASQKELNGTKTMEDNVSVSSEFASDDDDDDDDDDDEDTDRCGKRRPQLSDAQVKIKCLSTLSLSQAGGMTCSCATNCIPQLTLAQTKDIQKLFWGTRMNEYPSSNERTKKIEDLLLTSYNPAEKKFQFKAYDPLKQVTSLICESAIVTILFGATEASQNCSLNTAPRQWRTIKNKVKRSFLEGDGECTTDPAVVEKWLLKSKQTRGLKIERCTKYIQKYVNENCECSVIEPGIKFLPFRSLNAFYNDYLLSSLLSFGNDSGGGDYRKTFESQRTFERAFNLFCKVNKESKIRFVRGKGSFNVCEVCTTAADLLTTRRFSRVIRDLIGQYRK